MGVAVRKGFQSILTILSIVNEGVNAPHFTRASLWPPLPLMQQNPFAKYPSIRHYIAVYNTGLERKQLAMNTQSTVKVITFDQDIEMVDIENYETSAGVVTTTSNIVSASQNMSLQETPNRKFLKALRRRDTVLQDHSLGDNLGPQDSMAKAMDKGSISKGISIKKLKQRCKEKVKNYKTTRKKKIILEPKQRLIHEFYTRTPVYNIAGLDGDVDFQTKMAENSNNQAGLERERDVW